jgi:hypothetical protein
VIVAIPLMVPAVEALNPTTSDVVFVAEPPRPVNAPEAVTPLVAPPMLPSKFSEKLPAVARLLTLSVSLTAVPTWTMPKFTGFGDAALAVA